MVTRYCFDSSALLTAWRKFHPMYPPDVFPTFWNDLNAMIAAGNVFVCVEVYREMVGDRQQDKIAEWLRDHKKQSPDFVRPDHQEKINVAAEIIRDFDFPSLLGKNGNAADPYVIAHAKMEGAAVVSEEAPGRDNAPTIPYVCERLGVRHLYLVDFMRENGMVFSHTKRP